MKCASRHSCVPWIWVSSILVTGVSCFKLNISPEHIHFDGHAEGKITCATEPPEPIKECLFSSWYIGDNVPGKLLRETTSKTLEDIEALLESEEDVEDIEALLIDRRDMTLSIDPVITNTAAEYYISNFDGAAGTCSLQLSSIYWLNHLLVGCKLTAKSNNTASTTMSVYYRDGSQIKLSENNEEVLAKPGESVDILLQTEGPTRLRFCTATLANEDTFKIISRGDRGANIVEVDPPNALSRYAVLNTRLSDGKCGFTIKNVKEEDNGVISLIGFGEFWSAGAGAKAITLIVSKPPDRHTKMYVSPGGPYEEGQIIKYACVIPARQPTLTWRWWYKDYKRGLEIPLEGPQIGYNATIGWSWPWQVVKIVQQVEIPLKNYRYFGCTAGDKKKAYREKSTMNIITVDEPSRADENSPAIQNNDVSIPSSCVPGISPRFEALIPSSTKALQSVCGKVDVNPRTQHRIAGGKDASKGQFPWHAAIFYRKDGHSKLDLKCGGTLVTLTAVITAAHCMVNGGRVDRSRYRVALGKLQREWYDELDDRWVQRSAVRAVYTPEEFIGPGNNNVDDIAVVHLAMKIIRTWRVNVACLDWTHVLHDTQMRNGNNGSVAGWGLNSFNDLPKDLQWTQLTFIPRRPCFRKLRQESLAGRLTKDKFCAGFEKRATSVCEGDSGGGLVFLEKETERYYLRGVVSTTLLNHHNSYECSKHFYHGFTNVSAHFPWLRKKLELDDDSNSVNYSQE